MKSEVLFRAIGQISDEKIMEADMEITKSGASKPVLHRTDIFKSKPARRMMLRWGSVAACLIVALVITIPLMQRDTVETGSQGTPGTTTGEIAELYDNLNIYFLTSENVVAFESVFIRYNPEDIFSKWAELNSVEGVALINYSLNSNGFETVHGDPGDPGTTVSYTVGDYFTIDMTLSSEFAHYAEGENGQILVESLEKTFIGYHSTIDIDEFNLTIGD